MNEKMLQKVLREGTLPIADLASGVVDFRTFLSRYDNFYYRAGIDGFDCSPEQQRLLQQFAKAVDFHKSVQTIIDRVYLDALNNAEQFRSAGRIDEKEAEQSIREVAQRFDVSKIFDSLDSARTS
jgi:hypothetical protein